MTRPKMFEGMYKSFSEVKLSGKGFSDNFWISRERSRMKTLMSTSPEEMNASKDYPLLTVASMAIRENGSLTVLDYVGGAGKGFLSISRGIKTLKTLRYIIIELPEICALGKELIPNDPRVEFYENFSPCPNVDIFHFGSCLQYVDNWQIVLDEMKQYKPRFLLFSDLLAGDIDTFVTTQILFDSILPYRFININEFVKAVEDRGFKLRLRTNYHVSIKGEYGPLPTEHFPKAKRLKHSSNLLFSNKVN